MHWSFEDPAAFQESDEEKLEKFRQIRDLIEGKIISWLAEQGIPVQ
jgi:arsenate reductase